ncbi:flagellar basal body-associated FliL family protein [Hyphomonas sp.]|uniref:flagellar basal body-associated FliL family protein n=1 Tax=Hyphomonas sp. TaxID=87 RepID=UPI0030F99420
MKNIIAAVVVVVCIVIGGIGGSFLKSSSVVSSGKAEDAKEKSHGAKEEKGGHGAEASAKDSHGKKDSHGAVVSSSGVEYFKFTREFVVPIMRESRVESLVILNINLEVDASEIQRLFSMEPKIRDNIMTTLIELSNDGATLDSIATLENYESIRSTVLLNLQKILPDGIRNVLIVDMAKQDL